MFPRKKQFNTDPAPAKKPAQSSNDWLNSLGEKHKATPEGKSQTAAFQKKADRSSWEADNSSRVSKQQSKASYASMGKKPNPESSADWKNPGGSAGPYVPPVNKY